MADMSLAAKVSADTGDFTSGMERASEALGDFKEEAEGASRSTSKAGSSVSGFSAKCSALSGAIMGVAGNIAGRLFDAIASLSGEMVSAADSSQKFASTLSFAGIDTSTIEQLTASTQKYADETVYDLEDIRNVTAQLASNGVDNYAQLAEAAGNLNAVAGGNADTFKSVGMVMTQTAGAGKLMTENWNQLTDAIPGVSGPLQQAMRDAGAFEGNFRDAMANGEISADEFFQAVQKLGMQDVAVQAATSTSTIEGALGNLQASVVGVGSQVVSALTPMITGAMTQLSTFISSIPQTLAPVGDAIAAVFAGTGSMEGIGAAVGTLVTNMMTQATTAIQQFTAQLPAIMQSVVPSAIAALTTMLSSIMAQLPAMLQSLVGLISTAVSGLMETLGAQLPAMIQTLVPMLITAITSMVTEMMAQLPSIIMSFLGMVTSAISSFVSSIAAQIPAQLPALVSAAMSAINGLVSNVLSNLPSYIGQVTQAAVQLFQGIAQAIPQVLPEVISGIGDLVQTVISNIPSFLGALIQAAVTLFNGIVEAIPQVVPAVLVGIADLLQQVWDAITSFDLASAGVQLIQGLIDGVVSMAGALWDAIVGTVQGAVDGVLGFLGIHSPSKVFREIGEYSMEGLEQGIESEASGPVNAMSDAVAKMADVAAAYDSDEFVQQMSDTSAAIREMGEALSDVEDDEAKNQLGQWLESIADGADDLAKRRRGVDQTFRVFERAGVRFSQGFIDEVLSGSSEYSEHILDMADMTDEQLQRIVDLFDQSAITEKILDLRDALMADGGLAAAFDETGQDLTMFARDLVSFGFDVDDVMGKVRDFADAVSDGFNAVSVWNADTTLSDYTSTLENNISQAKYWARIVNQVFDKVSDYEPSTDFRMEVLNGGIEKYGRIIQELSGKTRDEIIKVIDLYNEAVAEGENAGMSVVGSLVPDVDQYYSVGRQITDGMANGIEDGTGQVTGAIKTMCESVEKTVTDYFGIASPSKLMFQFGDYSMQGFENGIESRAKAVAGTMRKALAGVADVVVPSLSSRSARLNYASVDGAAVEQKAPTVYQTNNFNQPVQTPYQMARAMKKQATYGLAGARS